MGIKDSNIDKKYSAIRSDLKYIENTYGQVHDYCGAFCNCEAFEKLLKTPSKETAFKILKSKLECYFSNGYATGEDPMYCTGGIIYKLPVEEDKKLENIKIRWNV